MVVVCEPVTVAVVAFANDASGRCVINTLRNQVNAQVRASGRVERHIIKLNRIAGDDDAVLSVARHYARSLRLVDNVIGNDIVVAALTATDTL